MERQEERQIMAVVERWPLQGGGVSRGSTAMGLMHITSQFFSSSAAYCMKARLGGIA